MWTPSCNIICLSWKRKLAQNDYHTVCPFTINIQTTDIIYFISERQYMLESANYRSKSHLLTNCNFTQVRTVTFRNIYLFFYSRWCEFAVKHSEDRSISDSFWCSKHSQTQPALYKSKTTKSWQIIPQKLYIWLGNRKAEEKTDWDKHYIATSAKCIVGRRREMMFSCFTQWRHQNDEHVILFMICTTYVFTSFP